MGGGSGVPPGSPTPGWVWALIGGLGVLLVVGLVVLAVLLTRSTKSNETGTVSQDTPPTSTTTSVETTETSTSSTAPATASTSITTVPTSAPPLGDVRTLPAGLLCRDLKAKGYSYSAAVDYWRVHGQPNQMDADKNGIPCETVYPRSDIVSYWPSANYQSIPSYGLPSGLLCRDLAARGIDVYGALLYYIWEGYPSRMDADGNGIPCESVYPDARVVWLYEF